MDPLPAAAGDPPSAKPPDAVGPVATRLVGAEAWVSRPTAVAAGMAVAAATITDGMSRAALLRVFMVAYPPVAFG